MKVGELGKNLHINKNDKNLINFVNWFENEQKTNEIS